MLVSNRPELVYLLTRNPVYIVPFKTANDFKAEYGPVALDRLRAQLDNQDETWLVWFDEGGWCNNYQLDDLAAFWRIECIERLADGVVYRLTRLPAAHSASH
jgi:hypothetical protein